MKLSLKRKVVLVIVLFTFVLSVCSVLLSYLTYINSFEDYYESLASSIAKSTATVVNKQQVEAVAEQKLLSMLPEDLRGDFDAAITIPDPEVRALVKAADKLSAYLKCVEEVKAGNDEFKKAKEQTYAALRQNPVPALGYFMEHFLDGFELTLDELS